MRRPVLTALALASVWTLGAVAQPLPKPGAGTAPSGSARGSAVVSAASVASASGSVRASGSAAASAAPRTPDGEEEPEDATEAPAPSSRAATAPSASAATDPDEDPVPEAVTPALDTLGGHFSAALGVGLAAPYGQLDSLRSADALLGSGTAFEFQLGYGVTRQLVLGGFGSYSSADGGDSCASCSATSFGGGAFARFHLVQGTRFDPWLLYGLGFRSLGLAGSGAGDLAYSGLDWLKLQVGGDWYAFDKLGVGPYLGLDAGTYLSRPGDAGSATHVTLSVGARVILDLPGK